MSNLKTKVKKKEMPTNPLTEMIFLEINRKNIIFVYNRVKQKTDSTGFIERDSRMKVEIICLLAFEILNRSVGFFFLLLLLLFALLVVYPFSSNSKSFRAIYYWKSKPFIDRIWWNVKRSGACIEWFTVCFVQAMSNRHCAKTFRIEVHKIPKRFKMHEIKVL